MNSKVSSLTLEFSEGAQGRITEMVLRLNIPAAEIVKNALSLYDFVTDPKEATEYDSIAIVTRRGKIKRIIDVPGRKTA